MKPATAKTTAMTIATTRKVMWRRCRVAGGAIERTQLTWRLLALAAPDDASAQLALALAGASVGLSWSGVGVCLAWLRPGAARTPARSTSPKC